LTYFLKVLRENGASRIEQLAISGVNVHRDTVPSLVSAVEYLSVLKKL